jgi:hypothetical protein
VYYCDINKQSKSESNQIRLSDDINNEETTNSKKAKKLIIEKKKITNQKTT